MALPPSKKTRALLAYLAVRQRPFRREQLCELLWEIPDDPRGSLRWSLSKLRKLVDHPERPRILADRAQVGFDGEAVAIDLLGLKALVADGLDDQPLADLQAAAERYRGNFLEGLELPNFYEFHAWCVAEREVASAAQGELLRALVRRLQDDPAAALPYARDLVALVPYQETERAQLIELLVALGRTDEAEQQYKLGQRLLDEVGATTTGALLSAWRGAPGGGPSRRSGTSGAEPAPARAELAPARAEPVPAAAESAAETPAADVHVDASLVGREAEIDALRAGYGRVVGGEGATVMLVCGEPGIGKTRLLDAAMDLARQAEVFVLESAAFESESMRPFALWIDALRKLPGVDLPDGFGAASPANRDRLFESLSELVDTRSQQQPVLVVFDDLQWGDDSSVAALHYVARMNRNRPFCALLGARDGELRDNAALQQALSGLRHDNLLQEMTLGPLPQDAVRSLVARLAPEVDSERLSSESGGNPLLAIELARAESAGGGGGSMADLVRERLGRIDVETAEILRWAAVLNPRIDVSWLTRVTGLDAMLVSQALETGVRQAILKEAAGAAAGGFRFSHNLVARGVYAEISPTRRRVMHGRVAEMLEQETALDLGHAADLAHHAAQSGDPGLGARSMVSAGRLCLRFFANDDAASLARQGLQLADNLSASERVCLHLDLHDIILAAAPLPDWQAAADEYVALAEEALDHGALAHARLGYHMAATVRWLHGEWGSAREQSLQAERVVRGGNEQEHIVGMAETAKCLAMLERDLSQADAMLMEAQALAARQRMSHHAIAAGLGILRFHAGDLDAAEELFRDSRTLCKSAGDRVNEFLANEYLVMIDLQRERFADAQRHCRALLEVGGKLREGSEEPCARALAALCGYALGDEDLEAFTAALADLRVADAKHRLAYALTRAANLELHRGAVDAAIEHALEALEYSQLLERPTETLLAHCVLAQARAAAGDPAGEAEHLAAIAALDQSAAAVWARERAQQLHS